jgi:hypothetical protein
MTYATNPSAMRFMVVTPGQTEARPLIGHSMETFEVSDLFAEFEVGVIFFRSRRIAAAGSRNSGSVEERSGADGVLEPADSARSAM